MRLFLLSLLLAFSCSAVFAQSIITGKLLDSKTKEPLIGATISIKGTTTAASATLTGSFKLTVPAPGSTTLVFSYVGYISKEIAVTATKNLGEVLLEANSSSLHEVVINAPVIDRKTPLAVSTVTALYIEEKGQGQDIPQLLKETPSVTVTESGGGFGDSRISIRGFSANNVAVLINGIPANDVESGKTYWSDWAGLTDVTSSIQAQRGMGASKVATPSLGGTIAITTRSFDSEAGGAISGSVGSFGANKLTLSVSSGLSDKGWASSFLLGRTAGDGIAPGLYFTSYSYFFNLTKKFSKTQTLSFNLLGAQQSHGQRFNKNLITTYKTASQGPQYNSDYGYLNGQLTSAEINYYNKPLASLNHIWTINSTTSLSTVGYASFGSGAARYLTNTSASPYKTLLPNQANEYPRTGDAFSPIDFDAIVKNNMANSDGSSLNYIQNVANSHQQYGVISSFNKTIGDNITVLAGADLRWYTGEHYYQVQDLLGGQYLYDARPSTPSASTGINSATGDINNPYHRAIVGDKFNNDYRFDVASEGLFLQTEYSKNDLTAFVTVAVSNTGNKRIDYFNYLNSDPNRESSYVNFLGYQAKGGVNYNINNYNNVFFNIGTLQRSPLVSNIFVNRNNSLNANAVPERLFSYELGYGFRSSSFTANLNLYRSSYKDKSVAPVTQLNTDGTTSSANISGVNELHQGIELEMRYRPNRDVTFRATGSLGSWKYSSNAGPVQVTSDNGFSSTQKELFVNGLPAGDAAQTTATFGVDVNILPKLKIGTTYTFNGNYASNYFNDTINGPGYQPYYIPNYSLFDLNSVFRFKFAGLDASFIGNVRNLFDTAYISDALDRTGIIAGSGIYGPTSSNIGVYYGTGRTYNTTLKIKF